MSKRPLIIASFAVCLSALSVVATDARAAAYSSRALIENARLLDNKKVSYKGEAVTAVMKRGDHAWVNVNDGDNAIGVWARADALGRIAFLGDYKHKGDVIEVEGLFHRACPEHGGTLDIHAHRVSVVKAGYPIRERVDVRAMYTAAVFFFVTLIVIAVFRKRI